MNISRYTFLFFFQWSLAAPDVPKNTEESDAGSFNINEALTNLSQGIQKVLSKENVDVSLFHSSQYFQFAFQMCSVYNFVISKFSEIHDKFG